MSTVDWIARSPCWLATALRGFANYGLSLSGMPCVVPIAIDPASPTRKECFKAIARDIGYGTRHRW